MKEEIVTFKQAKELKQLGFYDKPVYGFCNVYSLNTKYASYVSALTAHDEKYIYAPLLSLVLKWLRDVKKIQIIITTRTEGWWYFQLYQNWNFEECKTGYERESYEQAIIEAIDEAISLLKS